MYLAFALLWGFCSVAVHLFVNCRGGVGFWLGSPAFALKGQVANVRMTFHVRLLCPFPLAPLRFARVGLRRVRLAVSGEITSVLSVEVILFE
jgi:hypothetical protein